MTQFQKLRVLVVSQCLVLLALGVSVLAGLFMGAAGVHAGAKTELMREATRLQRMARSVRRDESMAVADEELSAKPSETLPEELADLAFGLGLAPFAHGEAYERLLQGGQGQGLHEIGIPAGKPLKHRFLSDLGLNGRRTLTAVALKREGAFLIKPPPETRLKKGDVLLVLGLDKDAVKLRAKLS